MKTFEVLKVLNHNVLLGVNQGKEYILTGKGIGFQMKPGLFVNEEKISNFHLIQDSQKLSDYEKFCIESRIITIQCPFCKHGGIDIFFDAEKEYLGKLIKITTCCKQKFKFI